MGWDQSTSRQDVQSFLLELMDIDPNELLREALTEKMAEANLSYTVIADTEREEDDGLYNIFHPDRITLSDGRVFVEAITEEQRGDDWGNDHYSFVEKGKPYLKVTQDRNHYSDPRITEILVEEK